MELSGGLPIWTKHPQTRNPALLAKTAGRAGDFLGTDQVLGFFSQYSRKAWRSFLSFS